MPLKLPAVITEMDPKKRQYVYFAFAVGLIIVLYLFVNSLLSDSKPVEGDAPVASATKGKTKALTHPPGQQISDRENWIGGAARELDALKRQTQDASRRQDQYNKELLSRIEHLQNNQTRSTAVAPTEPPQAPTAAREPPPPPAPQAYPPRAGAYPPGAPNSPYRSTQPGSGEAPGVTPPVQVGMIRVTLRPAAESAGSGTPGVVPNSAGSDTRKEIPRVGTHLPVSFFKSTMLSGIDAPTGGTAQRNPLPVLMRIDDLAILPNRFRSDVKECFAVGEATGSMSAERAYIRVIRLSCVSFRGEIIEVDAIGVVHGPDGKVGVRGRLVEKQGAILGKALLAGIASGIGQGFAQQNSFYSVSPLGAVQTIDPSKALQTGLLNGVSKAMDQLAKFYIDSAAAIHPIIEVDAGTAVDIVITQKISFGSPLPASGPDGGAVPSRVLDRSALARQINSVSDQEE